MSGYQGRFGRDSAVEFFKRDDWYHQMFVTYGGVHALHTLLYRHLRYKAISCIAHLLVTARFLFSRAP